ncbi:MAG: hypothetical protein AAGA96_14120 [Verrucomicrobiota bacterium]
MIPFTIRTYGIFALALVGSVLPTAAQTEAWREWTAADGRTLEAAAVSVTEDSVTVKRKADAKELTIPLSSLSEADQAHAAELLEAQKEAERLANQYQPELFSSIEPFYETDFPEDGPHDLGKQWVIRQETQWNVIDGVLVGDLAPVEYQEKMQAIGDTHDGTRTVIFLKPVPKALVLQARIKYTETEKKGRDPGALLDLGHHLNSLTFREEHTRLVLKGGKKIFIEGDFFPLNEWNEITIEIKEGVLLIQVNDRKEIIEDPLISLASNSEFQQIDFKGQDFGTIQIDWLKLYQGIE